MNAVPQTPVAPSEMPFSSEVVPTTVSATVTTAVPAVPPAKEPQVANEQQAASEQRARSDRRKKPTSPWDAFRFRGRRMHNRRGDEHRQEYFVDRFSNGILLVVLLLIIATLVDAALTIHILSSGGEEVNPLMEILLNHSIEAFVFGKYLLTVVGLPLLLIFKNHYLFGTPLRVGHLIVVAVLLYVVLICYQVVLIQNCVGW
jgi:hypothetical protein